MADTPVVNASDSNFWTDLSQELGKSAAGAGSGRAAMVDAQQKRDLLASKLYEIAQQARTQAAAQRTGVAQANLASDKFRTSLPGQGAQEAVRGSLIQNVQPASLNLPAGSKIPQITFSGGLNPSALSPDARAAGGALAAHGRALIDNPGSFTGADLSTATDPSQFLTAPTLSDIPGPSFWEQAAGVGGITSGLLSALTRGGGSSAANALKKLLGGGSSPGGIDNSGNTEDTRTADTRTPSTSGVAYGPDGQPLPVGSGGGYYDDATGQYVPDTPANDGSGGYYDDATGQYIG